MSMNTPHMYACIEALRPQLLKFATFQLQDKQLAEDVVQDTLLAALEGIKQFNQQASIRTWVTGILKFKIIDQFRYKKKNTQQSVVFDDETASFDPLDELFKEDGHFIDAPCHWTDQPENLLKQRQFFDLLEMCISHIPAQIGRAFMMREWLEFSTQEICQELSITQSNCWVILYRARMHLRECMSQHWS